MAENLVVSDEYFIDMAEYFKKQGEYFEEMIVAYRHVMKIICENAMIEGKTHNALETYIAMSECLENVMSITSISMEKRLYNFVEEIDILDKYIY